MNVLKAMRPLHWIKNLLVLTPVFFSGNLFFPDMLIKELVAFVSFCFISSHAYLINDILDLESDREDDEKKNRVIASGILDPQDAFLVSLDLAIFSLLLAYSLNIRFAFCILVYAFLTHIYSLFLKKLYIPGIAAIAAGMLLRILAGAVAINVEISPWVYPSAFILTFYVVAGKRIFDYNRDAKLEKNIFLISGILTTVVYAIYTFSGVGQEKYETDYLWTTIPLVAAACARYFKVIFKHNGSREHLLSTLSDIPLIIAVFCWALVFGFLIY